MNTKVLMTVSALIMGVTGVVLLFMPEEIAGYLSLTAPSSLELMVLQLMAALYFSFAMINWTARANLIGGIYARPISVGNLTHFFMGALTLGKGYVRNKEMMILIPAVVYIGLAACFISVFFTHPVPKKSNDAA